MARIQDLNMLHALKYEPVLRTWLAASSFKPHEINEVLLETYARVLATGAWAVTDAKHIGPLTIRTASTAAWELLQERRLGPNRSANSDGSSFQALALKDIPRLPSWVPLDTAAIAAIVDRLPPRSREVLLLHKAMCLRPHEIAERLHVSEEEVTRRMLVAIREYAVSLLTDTGARL